MSLGELWIDASDAPARIASLNVSKGTADHLKYFWENGYTIFRGVVPDEATTTVATEMTTVSQHPERYVIRRQGKYVDPADVKSLGPGGRVIDIYGVSPAARSAIYPQPIAEFLMTLFGEPAIAMQSLNFEYGSQQAIHQDTAYVVSTKPLSLAASWIALEDVTPGSGELIYYPGSHRFKHYMFGGDSKAWAQNVHGEAAHKEFLAQLHEQAKAMGMKQESFLAKKGDVLIWHADLAHGGARITNKNTRRSLVVHFCPESVKPAYVKQIPQQYIEVKDDSGNCFASRHYDMRFFDSEGRCKILYDGGVTRNREAKKQAAAVTH
jgi:hypothetical protein